MKSQERFVLDFLTTHGASRSVEIRSALGVSQPTASRILGALADDLVVIGSGKLTQYAVAEPIGIFPAQQTVWLIGGDGVAKRFANLSFLGKSQIYIEADGVGELYESTPENPLPWYLSGLMAQGFLGRILAQKLNGHGIGENPASWSVSDVLFAALHTYDAPGSILLGSIAKRAKEYLVDIADSGQALDAYSEDIAKSLPTGSSAGGEQPKFLVRGSDGEVYLVKFSPPLGTPFGDRWSDLLCAEVLSSVVLQRHGYSAAVNKIVRTQNRTYLLSKRFDRHEHGGRSHVVSLGAVHAAFVKGAYSGWTSTCDVLVRQKRLSAADAGIAHSMHQFGALIGNTDMHSGNAGFFVDGETLRDFLDAKFRLVPVYDMLPMRWKPDAMFGVRDYEAFDVDLSFADESVRAAAADFWKTAADCEQFSEGFRDLALLMTQEFFSQIYCPREARS